MLQCNENFIAPGEPATRHVGFDCGGYLKSRGYLTFGTVSLIHVEPSIWVANMIAQFRKLAGGGYALKSPATTEPLLGGSFRA
jgi:hypothetical protein